MRYYTRRERKTLWLMPCPGSLQISTISTNLFEMLQQSWKEDPHLVSLIADLMRDPNSHKHYTWVKGQLKRKGKLVVGNHDQLPTLIISLMHDNLQAGHSGIEATCQRIRQRFYWKGMKKDVQGYIHNCHTCQQCKYDAAAYPDKLQPLPIPNALWTEVSMDFIDGLPKSMGNDSILVVVDRLSKSTHFIPLKHPYSAAIVAQAYFDFVYKLHGMPQSIVSNRDTIFLSNFWQELFAVQGVNLSMSTAYHPQSDGQTEVINRQVSISHRSNQKLARKYYGPYKILSKVGAVAYKLELPPKARIHHTFHVSLLKRCYGSVPEEPSFPIEPIEPGALKEPELILAKKTVQRGRVSATKVLVKWSDSEIEDTTWEFLYDLLQTYPKFNPWEQGSLEGRGNDASQEPAAMSISTGKDGAKLSHLNMEGNNCKKVKGGAQEDEHMDNHMKVLSHEGLVTKEALMTSMGGNESVGIAHEISTT
ncbi:uncharacterized protein LOC141608153 [Silene latifolia]|uniref:uncharacterized protein LOC141608153 n=1 Tax=Silene latifolia TaxID=37657 RepID=UPI003D773CDB